MGSYLKKISFKKYIYYWLNKLNSYRYFRNDFNKFKTLSITSRFPINWHEIYPCLNEGTQETNFDRHYVFHTSWAARILSHKKPDLHVDISSSLYFVAIVSAFIPLKFYDYRPAELNLNNLETCHADLTKLPFPDESIQSLSCMHVVEHIGLGRYGDHLDPDGDLKAIKELKRVIRKGGELLFVVPIGRPKIMFNAHRIYSYEQIISYFENFTLKEFSLIPDNPSDGGLIINTTKEMADKQDYGCGCFWFERIK